MFKKRKKLTAIVVALLIVAAAAGTYAVLTADRNSAGSDDSTPTDSGEAQEKAYNGSDFGIETAVSAVDFDNDGIDDYSDIMQGARIDAENHPQYDNAYCQGGYPPDDVGVCTDLVWRAFRNAGYCLKDMVDKDVASNTADYPDISEPDPNIDFRRGRTLDVFFSRFGQTLSNDIDDIEQWQAGDIVVFDNNHVGIISDKRDEDGHTYVIHNMGQTDREDDYLGRRKVVGHYRFDASQIDDDCLVKWHE